MAPEVLEQLPQIDLDAAAGILGIDGRGEWHENAEMRKLIRPMTSEEASDTAGYDRALYRAREASLQRLRKRFGEVWMLVPKHENRARQWLPERIYRGMAA